MIYMAQKENHLYDCKQTPTKPDYLGMCPSSLLPSIPDTTMNNLASIPSHLRVG